MMDKAKKKREIRIACLIEDSVLFLLYSFDFDVDDGGDDGGVWWERNVCV